MRRNATTTVRPTNNQSEANIPAQINKRCGCDAKAHQRCRQSTARRLIRRSQSGGAILLRIRCDLPGSKALRNDERERENSQHSATASSNQRRNKVKKSTVEFCAPPCGLNGERRSLQHRRQSRLNDNSAAANSMQASARIQQVHTDEWKVQVAPFVRALGLAEILAALGVAHLSIEALHCVRQCHMKSCVCKCELRN